MPGLPCALSSVPLAYLGLKLNSPVFPSFPSSVPLLIPLPVSLLHAPSCVLAWSLHRMIYDSCIIGVSRNMVSLWRTACSQRDRRSPACDTKTVFYSGRHAGEQEACQPSLWGDWWMDWSLDISTETLQIDISPCAWFKCGALRAILRWEKQEVVKC